MKTNDLLNQLADDISDSYDVIEAGGGAMPSDRITWNLANAIRSVPGPTPPVPPTPPVEEILYGRIGYYPWTEGWWASGDMCEVENIDQTQLNAFFEEYPPMDQWIDMDYEPEYDPETWEPIGPGTWRYMGESGDMQLTTEELQTQMGITVVLEDELEWAMLMLEKTYNVDTTANVIYVQFPSEQALLDAGWPSDDVGGDYEHYVLTVGNAQVYNQAIKSYDFGSEISEFGDYFLYATYLMDTVDASRTTITSVADNFMCYSLFNDPMDFSHCVSIGDNFLGGCRYFNQPVDVSRATTLGNNFLEGCRTFNSSLTLNPSLTTIPYRFLEYCYAFNQPLTLPSGITKIEDGFLEDCHAFNQPFTIPNTVTSIGDRFLMDCKAFNQNITIPENCYWDEYYSLYGCEQMVSTIYLGAYTIEKLRSNSETFLGVGTVTVPAYTQGIKIQVPSASVSIFQNKVPNRTSRSPYRKTIVTGA